MRILVFATQGSGKGDEGRIIQLLRSFKIHLIPFESMGWRAKLRSSKLILRDTIRLKPDLIVMEGSGVAGGILLLVARIFFGFRYILSSGDAIAPFIASKSILLYPFFLFYEILLYRLSSGFIGWTPYLCGRALTFGAPRVMTAAGWAVSPLPGELRSATRIRMREELSIPENAIVIGIAGSLNWSQKKHFCYGYDLVKAALRTSNLDCIILIVGDGSGKKELEKLAGSELGKRIRFTGRIPSDQVGHYLAAMDVGSLSQSVDGVGSFRYTLKLSEYLAANLPVVTSQIPLSYDLDSGWLWRIQGNAPWDEQYIDSLTQWMNELSPADVYEKRNLIPNQIKEFDQSIQVNRVTQFVLDLLKHECQPRISKSLDKIQSFFHK